jgi:3-hydroxyisobutyrate dehydrogenase-like beta-hydroxyacid dehydrogenase
VAEHGEGASVETRVVGVVGLGDMGMPVLSCYLAAGFQVLGYDIRPEACEEASRRGARISASIEELGQEADAVAVVVVDDRQVREVTTGAGGLFGAMRPGATLLLHSTTKPAVVEDLASKARDAGIEFLDCPVTGAAEAAAEAALTILVGGDDQLVARMTPVLEALGTVEHVGPVGAGQVVKIANNMLGAGNRAMIYQALEFIRPFGIPEERALELWQQGSADSWQLRHLKFRDRFLEQHVPQRGAEVFNYMTKDVFAAVVVAREHHIHLPLAAMVAEALPAMMEARYVESQRSEAPPAADGAE